MQNMKSASNNSYDDYCRIFYSDLVIYSIGIFSLYHHASYKVKTQILALIRNYYIPLKR